MDESDDLPRLPADQLDLPLRPIADLKPGEQAVLSVVLDVDADEAGHLWVDMSGKARGFPVMPGFSLLAQRSHKGFIVWLDKKVKFTRRPLFRAPGICLWLIFGARTRANACCTGRRV
jgi:hypothetical protein